MLFFRKYFGRKIAIKLYWIIILFLVGFMIFDIYDNVSDCITTIVLGSCVGGGLILAIYISNAKKKFIKGNLEFIFSQERNNCVEMHFKRNSCEEIKHFRTALYAALTDMHSYAQTIDAKRLVFESPLFDEKSSLIIAKLFAEKLSVNYELQQPKAMNWVVSILAHREINKCRKTKTSLCKSLSAKLITHGFSLDLLRPM